MAERIESCWRWIDGGRNCKLVKEEDNWKDSTLVQEGTWNVPGTWVAGRQEFMMFS